MAIATLGVVALGAAARGQEATGGIPAELRGDAGLSVLATDEQGHGVPDVAVVLRREDSPRAVQGLATGEDGRLTVTGLADGEWQVDLVREGFMLVTAYLRLEAGGEPDVAFSSRQRTGTYWAALNVAFLRPEDPSNAALRTGRGSVKAARKEAARRERQERRAAVRRERRAQRPDTAKVVEAPERPATVRSEAPGGTPAPIAAAAREPAPPVEEAHQPEAPVDVAVEPVTAELPVARPDTPEERELAAARPRLLPNPELRPAGACVECRAGEWSVTAQARAAPAGLCPSGSAELLDGVARSILDGLRGELRQYAGAVLADDENDVRRLLEEGALAEMTRLLGALAEPTSSCVVVGVVLPAGAEYVGFRYLAGERSMTADCLLGEECRIGDAGWRGPPAVVRSDANTVVLAVFENRSAKRERTAQLTVYFRPARGWLPPAR